MSYEKISVHPISDAIGAVISGVDLATLDDQTFEEIHRVFLEHLVIFFHHQDITPEQQIVFSRRFGEIDYYPFVDGMKAYLIDKAPFNDERKRMELLARLNEIRDVSLPKDSINKRPSIPLATLATGDNLQQFLRVIDWAVQEIKAT